VASTIIVESALYIAGVWIYLRTTRARDRLGNILPWVLIIFLAVVYVTSMKPPTPETPPKKIAWVAQVEWMIIALAWWADRHREART